ncbi:MAG: potassium channel family protein [Actinomycetales bacterium]
MTSQAAAPTAPDKASARERWLHNYVLRTSPWLSGLALVYLITWSIEAIWSDPQALWHKILSAFGFFLWALFAADLLLRFVVTPNRHKFFRHNLLDTLTVVVPQFRALRVLRIFTKHGLVSSKNGGLSRGALTTALLGTVLVVWIGSLMVLNAERDAAGAQITDVRTAVWWCLQTVTTVGYGDVIPITLAGQTLAVLVMLVGISVVGSVSASLAATLIKQQPKPSSAPPAQGDIHAELADLKAMVGELQATVNQLRNEKPPAAI